MTLSQINGFPYSTWLNPKSCLLANRFRTGQFLVKTALFGPFDQNTSKHMPDPSADTLAENDQSLSQQTDRHPSKKRSQRK